jgi:hypothetical protein
MSFKVLAAKHFGHFTSPGEGLFLGGTFSRINPVTPIITRMKNAITAPMVARSDGLAGLRSNNPLIGLT